MLRVDVDTSDVLCKFRMMAPQSEQAGLDEFAVDPAKAQPDVAKDQGQDGITEMFASQADVEDVFTLRGE